VSRKAQRADKRLDLTAKEFKLLSLLLRRRGQILSRTTLAEQVWDMNFDSTPTSSRSRCAAARQARRPVRAQAAAHRARHGLRAGRALMAGRRYSIVGRLCRQPDLADAASAWASCAAASMRPRDVHQGRAEGQLAGKAILMRELMTAAAKKGGLDEVVSKLQFFAPRRPGTVLEVWRRRRQPLVPRRPGAGTPGRDLEEHRLRLRAAARARRCTAASPPTGRCTSACSPASR
jgi:hypothetical protein